MGPGPGGAVVSRLNGRWHRVSLMAFGGIVVAHWIEHWVQAVQIWGFGVARPEARGAVGHLFPWLVTSEGLHYAYAVVMVGGLALLRPGFAGRARSFWTLALGIQVWHHFEHALLLYQARAHTNLFGRAAPTSVLQLVWQRAEVHLFYNALVTVPMLLALWLHTRPAPGERHLASCTCARSPALAVP